MHAASIVKQSIPLKDMASPTQPYASCTPCDCITSKDSVPFGTDTRRIAVIYQIAVNMACRPNAFRSAASDCVVSYPSLR
jgi:hypothetical protein